MRNNVEITRGNGLWKVSVKPGAYTADTPLSEKWPKSPCVVGTINARGTLSPWSYGRGAPRGFTAWSKLILQDAKRELIRTGELSTKESREAADYEHSSGAFLVSLTGGRYERFHESRKAHDWAEAEIKRMPQGSYAEITRGENPPTVLSILTLNEYGHVVRATSVSSMDLFTASYGVDQRIGRYGSQELAKEAADRIWDEHRKLYPNMPIVIHGEYLLTKPGQRKTVVFHQQ